MLGDLRRAGGRDRRRRRTSERRACSPARCGGAWCSSPCSRPRYRADSRTLALKGAASVTANAVLVDEPWGTSLTLSETGLPGGRGLHGLDEDSRTGAWWVAGTYRSVSGSTVNATMSCAVSLPHITDFAW